MTRIYEGAELGILNPSEGLVACLRLSSQLVVEKLMSVLDGAKLKSGVKGTTEDAEGDYTEQHPA
jgi:hypothetical protein